MSIPRLRADDTVLLIVDLQEKLLPAMHEAAAVEQAAGRLIEGGAVLGLPMILTQQYPQGLGPTVRSIARRLPAEVRPIDKQQFSALVDPVAARLRELGRSTVLLCGIEAHVCILQTALDLAQAGYKTAVAADATGSRRPLDRQIGLERVFSAGILPTTVEGALLEMAGGADHPQFGQLLPIIK